jgi:hypothetical protein
MLGRPSVARAATADDLDAVVDLLRARRSQLAGWAPIWWRPAKGADEVHRLWLGHLIDSRDVVVRVVEGAGGEVAGCVAAVPQVWGTLVDDLAVAGDADQVATAAALLEAVPDRPARVCVPAADAASADAAGLVGMFAVSSYWVALVGDGGPPAPRPRSVPANLPPPVPHTFGPPFPPDVEGALLVADERGIVVGSRSIVAPPVFDPGGTVAVVDRLHGPDRETAVAAARQEAGARGDAVLAVVAAAGDGALASALAAGGFQHVVDVYAWV